jgi:hypothetical protein
MARAGRRRAAERIDAHRRARLQFTFHGRLPSHDATMNRRTHLAYANTALSSRAALRVLPLGMAGIGIGIDRAVRHLP